MSVMSANFASSALYQNILLLTYTTPPSDIFKKHFREGMFDKPNTAGFIYVSHYLLTVYDEQRFIKTVQWPVTCKKTEAKYRNDVKDLLTSVATENPDIGFPSILTSYLFHAAGTKFRLIMWKLSIVVLRTYIKKNCDRSVFFAPKPGITDDLAKQCLKRQISKIDSSIYDIHKDITIMTDAAKVAAVEESEALAKIKTQLFDTKQSITNAVSDAPADPCIKKRLLNVEDTDIIPMWKASISNSIHYVERRCGILREMERLIAKTTVTVTNRLFGTKMLDMKNLRLLDSSKLSTLPLSPENQCLLHHLYKHDRVVLHNFITLVSLLLQQLYSRLKQNNLVDLSKHLVLIEASNEDMKSAADVFDGFLITIANTSTEIKNRLYQKNVCQSYSDNMMAMINNVLLAESPLIKISVDYQDERNDLQKRLEFTPVESVHKSLFSRYKRRTTNNTSQTPLLRSNLLISRINFDDVTSSSNNSVQTPRRRLVTSKANPMSVKGAEKYSRLFSVCAKKKRSKVNYSLMSIPSSSKANSTAVLNSTGEMPPVLELSLDITEKGLFNVSKELYNVTSEKDSRKLSESQTTFEEAEEVKDVPESAVFKAANEKRRLSISDLVDRYKKIVDVKK